MRFGRSGKWIVLVVLVLFLLAAAGNLCFSQFVLPQKEPEPAGRYQISSWGAFGGVRVAYSGYYVVDTQTGKVVDRGYHIHSLTKAREKD